MGWEGFATLIGYMAIITASGGLTLLFCWTIVLKFARLPAPRTPVADVIFVMGARLDRGQATREFQARLGEAARLAIRCPVIVLGGMASDGGPTEAAAGHQWLIAQGFDKNRILKEEASRNTLENLAHAREIMRRHDFRRPVLVTSRYHLARCSIIAAGFGMPHELFPTDYPTMLDPAALARSLFEALMINWYYVTRVLARATRYRGLLARIS